MKSNGARMNSTCLKNRCVDKMGEYGCEFIQLVKTLREEYFGQKRP